MSDTPSADDHRDERAQGDARGGDVPEPTGPDADPHDRHERDNVDRRFAEIIAHWDDPVVSPPVPDRGGQTPGVNPPPHVARLPPRAEPPARPPSAPRTTPPITPPAAPDQGWRGYSAEDEEEHFVPPPPRPLPAGDLSFWAILVGLLGGPLLLLYLAFFDRSAGSLWVAAGLAMTVGGFGLLVARQPRRRDEDDDDTGAQV